MQLDRTSSFNPLQLTDFGYLDSFLSLSLKEYFFVFKQNSPSARVFVNRDRVSIRIVIVCVSFNSKESSESPSVCFCLCPVFVCPFSNKKISTSVLHEADAPLSVKTGKPYTMASQRGRRSTLLPASDQLFVLFTALLFLSGTKEMSSYFGKNAK